MFKISRLFWLTPLALMASTANAQPAAKLPASVAATMPTRVLDIATYRIAPAPGEPQLLIHLWGAPRRNPDGAGSFGAPAGTYKGQISVEEVNSFNSLRLSPFVYDIFAPNSHGGWDYRNSIVHLDISAPGAPSIRYLNNKTKQGLVLVLSQFGGQYVSQRTLYALPHLESGAPFFKRDFSAVSPPANSGSVRQSFGRDARGYLQLIKAEDGFDEKTHKLLETRTIFSWDEPTRDWKAGQPVVTERK